MTTKKIFTSKMSFLIKIKFLHSNLSLGENNLMEEKFDELNIFSLHPNYTMQEHVIPISKPLQVIQGGQCPSKVSSKFKTENHH